MVLLIWFLEDVYARAPLFVCVLVTDPWWIIYQNLFYGCIWFSFVWLRPILKKNQTGNTSRICTVICGSMCLCALYNPLIWTEEGKIREQNMNGGMHEKHVKDSFFIIIIIFLCCILKHWLSHATRPDTSAGSCRPWNCVNRAKTRMTFYT